MAGVLSSDRESCHGAVGADTVRPHTAGIGSRPSSLMGTTSHLVIAVGPAIKVRSPDVKCAPNRAVGLSIAVDQSVHILCRLVAALSAG
jgi:hypothetical protein